MPIFAQNKTVWLWYLSVKIYSRLLDWKERWQGSKSALIEGARRIGKSTIVEEFARNEYKSYIIIDFNRASPTVKDAFRDYIDDLDTLFMLVSSAYNVKLYRRQSVIVLDEIQSYPLARQALKYLVADGRYDYIATGSLISIKENVKDITIPSEERSFKMYPMDFEEFAWAMGHAELLEYIKQCFVAQKPLEQGLHRKAMLLFRQYLIVGGMPKPVATYIDSERDFQKVDEEKRDILALYRNDIGKISARYKARVQAIFDQIPSFLSRSEKRVVLGRVEKGATYPKYHETFFWLADSMMVNECFNCTDPNVGLSLNEERSYIKCYMNDTGLLISHAFDENEISDGELYRELLHGKLSVNEGMIYENAIAQMLVAAGHKLYFYNHYNSELGRNDMEIDFIFSNNSKLKYKIFPVEVKSTDKYKTVSSTGFRSKFSGRIGGSYVIHPKNLKVEDNMVYIPAYMTFCL